MGKYINQTSKGQVGTSFSQKCKALMDDGAILTQKPIKFVPNLVCVIDNGWMAAAGYVYNEGEFEAFSNPNDPRNKRWFIWDKVEEYAQ
jgi:hypothetical protein